MCRNSEKKGRIIEIEREWDQAQWWQKAGGKWNVSGRILWKNLD